MAELLKRVDVHYRSRVTGSVTFVNVSGVTRTVRVKPFTVCDRTPWIEIVDEATERTEPVGEWIFDSESLSEEILPGEQTCDCDRREIA